MSNWSKIKKGERVEIGLLQIDIVGHSKIQDTDINLKTAKDKFRSLIEGIVKTRNGLLFSWAGDGGAFMFRLNTGEGFNEMCFSAKQMLDGLPATNREITISTGFNNTISVRISCDSGMVVYDKDASQISGDFVNKFLRACLETNFSGV